jgi:hypothetical protein
LTPHAAHGGRHDIAFAELAAGRVLDEANRFNA